MTVEQLIKDLKKLNPKAQIVFASDEEANQIYEKYILQTDDYIGLERNGYVIVPFKLLEETK